MVKLSAYYWLKLRSWITCSKYKSDDQQDDVIIVECSDSFPWNENNEMN